MTRSLALSRRIITNPNNNNSPDDEMSPIQSNPWDPQHHNPMDQLPPNIPKQPNPHFNNPDPQSPSKNLPKPKIVEMTESNKKQPGLHNPVRPPTPQVLQRPNNRQRHAPNAQFLRRVRQRRLHLHAAVPSHRRSGGGHAGRFRRVEAECRTVSLKDFSFGICWFY